MPKRWHSTDLRHHAPGGKNIAKKWQRTVGFALARSLLNIECAVKL
jgi:hypothetical protein